MGKIMKTIYFPLAMFKFEYFCIQADKYRNYNRIDDYTAWYESKIEFQAAIAQVRKLQKILGLAAIPVLKKYNF